MAVPHSLAGSVSRSLRVNVHSQPVKDITELPLWHERILSDGLDFCSPFASQENRWFHFSLQPVRVSGRVLCTKPVGWVAIMARWGALSYGKIQKNRNRKSWLTTKPHLIPECSTTFFLNRNLNFVMWIWGHKRITRILKIDHCLGPDLVLFLKFI